MSGYPIGVVDTDVGPLLAPIDPWIWPCLVDTGRWEPLVGDLVREILSPGDTVINVGAHVGYFTRMAALSVGRRGHVTAYEPAPSNRKILGLNTTGMPNISIRSAAVSDVAGLGELGLSGDNPGDHRLGVHEGATGATPVDVVRLDDELFPGAPPRLILTDAQGHDLKILRGARETIDRARPHLLIEWSPYLLDPADYAEVDRLLDAGYTARIVEAGITLGCAADGDIIAPDRGTGTLHLDPG